MSSIHATLESDLQSMPTRALSLPRAEFLGIDFDLLTFADAVAWLKARGVDDCFDYIVTPNVDHIVRLNRADKQFALLWAAAALRLCDSRVLSGLAWMAGIALPVVPGSDLVVALFGSVIAPGDSVAIIGGHENSVARLRDRYPAFNLYHINAPMGLRDNPAARAAIVTDMRSHRARFTLIAIGSPQQEMLASEMLADSKVNGTALCIGASIDFIVGYQRRAPRVVQRIGMEWAWRLGSDPRRLWRRYLLEGPKIFLLFWKWRRRTRLQ